MQPAVNLEIGSQNCPKSKNGFEYSCRLEMLFSVTVMFFFNALEKTGKGFKGVHKMCAGSHRCTEEVQMVSWTLTVIGRQLEVRFGIVLKIDSWKGWVWLTSLPNWKPMLSTLWRGWNSYYISFLIQFGGCGWDPQISSDGKGQYRTFCRNNSCLGTLETVSISICLSDGQHERGFMDFWSKLIG